MAFNRRITKDAGFVPITLDEYVKKHLVSTPRVDADELRSRLQSVLAAKVAGARCECGNQIWVLGSVEVGLMCFTCITGAAMPDDDYELYCAGGDA